MTAKLVVKSMLDLPLEQRARFWIETDVNGRTAQSRGFTLDLSEDLRDSKFLADTAEMAQGQLNIAVNDGLSLKQADAFLRQTVEQMIAEAQQFQDDVKSFGQDQ